MLNEGHQGKKASGLEDEDFDHVIGGKTVIVYDQHGKKHVIDIDKNTLPGSGKCGTKEVT